MEQLDVFDCSNVLIASYFPMIGSVLMKIGNIRSFISVLVDWRSRNVERKPFCIREIVPLCGVITECGCKRGSGRVSLIVPLC